MTFNKTMIAAFIGSLGVGPAFAGEQITIGQNSPAQLIVPQDGQIDKVVFDTRNRDVNHRISIGSIDNPIANLNIAGGLDRENNLNNSEVGGKVLLDIYASNATLGTHGIGLNLTRTITIPGSSESATIKGSEFNFYVDTLTSNAGTEPGDYSPHKFIGLSVGSESTVKVKATGAVQINSSSNGSLYAEEKSTAKINAGSIALSANSDNTSFATVVTATSDGNIDLQSDSDISIQNHYSRGGTAITVNDSGQVSMLAKNAISVLGSESQAALMLNQNRNGSFNSQNSAITLTANNIDLHGYVESSVLDRKDTNGIFLNANESLSIVGNNTDGAICAKKNSTLGFKAGTLNIENLNSESRSSAVRLEKNSRLQTTLGAGQSTIKGVNGIYTYNGSPQLTILGNAEGTSSLKVQGTWNGIVGIDGAITTNDVSLDFDVTREGNLPAYSSWGINGGQGLVGVLAAGTSKVQFSNQASAGKTLNVTIDAKTNSVKSSGLNADMGGELTVSQFENVVIDVSNTGVDSSVYGLRSCSGTMRIKDVDTVSVTTNKGDAVYLSSYSNQPDGALEISSKNVTLDGSTLGNGLNLNGNGTLSISVQKILDIRGKNALVVQDPEAVLTVDAESSTQSTITGNWDVKEGQASVSLGSNADIKGDMTTTNGSLSMSMKDNGKFTGAANGTQLDLTFGDKSAWQLTADSSVTSLTGNGALINFAGLPDQGEAIHTSQYRKLQTQAFKGTGNTLAMHIDLANETASQKLLDQFVVTGKAEGTHVAKISFDSVDAVKSHSINWLISQGEGSNMTITNRDGSNTFSGRGMVSVWSLGFVKTGEETLLDTDDGRQQISTQTNGNGPGKWYLVKSENSQPDPGPSPDPIPNPNPPTPTLPPEVNDNITIGTSSGQAEAYQADMEDLRKRTGEVRYGAQDGGWVSVFGKKDSVKARGTAGFKQEIYGLNIGVDRLVHADEDSAWLFGGAFRYSDADQKGLGSGYTTGTLQEYSGKLYATWMHDKGSYADFVLQAGRYEQELEGFDNTGMDKSKADYGTWGFGASVEVGHMFSFDSGVDDRRWFNHWFVEPQLQLSYFLAKGADYTTSTGLKVDQGNADFLTGRAGFVLGKKFNYGTIDDLDRRYFQVALLGGVKHEFLGGDQTISYTGVDGAKASIRAGDIDGTRFYYGVNCDWQVTENFRLYAQASREEGDRYTKDYDISIGGKLLF